MCLRNFLKKTVSTGTNYVRDLFWIDINVQQAQYFLYRNSLSEQSQPECWPYSPGVNWSDGVCAMASGCRTGHSAYVDWRPGTATRSHSRHYPPAGTKNTATVSVVDSSSQVSQPSGHRGRLRPLRMPVVSESHQKWSKWWVTSRRSWMRSSRVWMKSSRRWMRINRFGRDPSECG